MQGNVIVDLTGGTAGMNLVDVVWDELTDLLTFTRKDGTTFDIDLASLSIDLQVAGAVVEPNGDIKLTVIDPNPPAGGSPTIDVIIPLSHKANITYVDAQDKMIDDKNEDRVVHAPATGAVNTSGYKVLSEEDFTTALLTKLNNLPGVVVEDVTLGQTGFPEMIVITMSDGTKVPLVDLADKVDKVPGLGLSANDFTDILKTKLDTLDVTGVKTIAYDAANRNVEITDYAGTTTVAFQIPRPAQADWDMTNSNDDSFIKNKNSVMTPISDNAVGVAKNAADITAVDVHLTAVEVKADKATADILVTNVAVAGNGTNIAGLRTDVTGVQAAITGAKNDITAMGARVTTNESDIADLQQDNASDAGRLTALEQDLARNNAQDVTQDTEIASNKGRIVVLEGATATNAADIGNINTANIALDLKVNTNEQNILQNQNDGKVYRIDIDQNAADILALQGGIGMSDNQIRDAIQRAGNSNVLDDADKLKLDNLSPNQMAIDAAQDAALAKEIVDRTTADTAEVAARTAAINAEELARIAGDNVITTNLTQEISDRSAAIMQEIADRDAAILVEENARHLAETTLTSDLAAEVAKRTADDATEKAARIAADTAIDTRATAAAAKATTDFVNVSGDTMTGQLSIPKRTGNAHAVRADAYATSTLGGTLKARLVGTVLRLTNNGSNA